MKKISIIGLMLVACMTMMTPAHAKGFGMFGEKDSIHKIQDIEFEATQGESLYLGYMTESYFLFAGVYMKDAGYVIGINGSDKGYYPMPEGAELKSMQEAGVLPNPLPEYKISLTDYLFGFSLWLLLPFIFLWTKLTGNKD